MLLLPLLLFFRRYTGADRPATSSFELSKVPTHHSVQAQNQIDRKETLEDGTIIVYYKTIPEQDSYEVQVRGLDGHAHTEISLFKKLRLATCLRELHLVQESTAPITKAEENGANM